MARTKAQHKRSFAGLIGALGGIPKAPQSTVAPTGPAAARVGMAVTATAGTWTGFPTPALSYQWQREGVAIAGATGLTYTPTSADLGQRIRFVVTATNRVGSVSAETAYTTAVTNPPPPT